MKRVLIVCLALVGCGQPCKEGETQCHGDTVEVCDPFATFRPVADCGQVGRAISVPLMCAYAGAPDGGYYSGNTCVLKK